MFELDALSVLAIGFGVVIMFILTYSMATIYKKCGTNEAMIVSGLFAVDGAGRPFRIITGGSAVVLPLIQQVSTISLAVRTVRVRTLDPMLTSDGVTLDLVVSTQVKINADDDSVAAAAQVILGKSVDEVAAMLAGVIESGLRSAVANMTVMQVKQGFDLSSLELTLNLVIPLSQLGFNCLSLSTDDLRESSMIDTDAPSVAQQN